MGVSFCLPLGNYTGFRDLLVWSPLNLVRTLTDKTVCSGNRKLLHK